MKKPRLHPAKTARQGDFRGSGRHTSLKELVRQAPGCALELERLEEEAETGRRYLSRLREEVVRLGMLAQIGLDRDTCLLYTSPSPRDRV